jgi:transposase-like protein
MVFAHESEHGSQWEAIRSIASKIGCTAGTLRRWVRQAERDHGVRPGLTSGERERRTELRRGDRPLRRTNEIPR